MHKIDSNGNVAGAYVDANPGSGIAGTLIDAPAMNSHQDELVNAIQDVGITLVKNTNTQLRDALRTVRGPPGGRLSVESNNPMGNGTSSTIYYHAYAHQTVWVPDRSTSLIVPRPISGGTTGTLSQALSDTTLSPAAGTNFKSYDMFLWLSAGAGNPLVLSRGPAWSTDTSRGTGASTSELSRVSTSVGQDLIVNRFAITNGPAAGKGLYVGTVRTTNASLFADQSNYRFVWNYYNQAQKEVRATDPTASWNYSTSTFRIVNGSLAGVGTIETVVGLLPSTLYDFNNGAGSLAQAPYGYVQIDAMNLFACTSVNVGHYCGIGVNSVTASSSHFTYQSLSVSSGNTFLTTANYRGVPAQLGYNYYCRLERTDAVGTTTWFGVSSQGTSGIFGSVWC